MKQFHTVEDHSFQLILFWQVTLFTFILDVLDDSDVLDFLDVLDVLDILDVLWCFN